MNRNWKHKSVQTLLTEHNDLGFHNPLDIIKHLARELVLNAFTKGWQGPPFDIIELAKLNGYEVAPSDLVIDARILPRPKNKYLIEYNPFQNPRRISFSIAHEIGHTLFSDCSETIRYRSKELETSAWELEFLCNVAAAEILLPYAVFSEDANNTPLNLDSLIELANKYKASLESVFIRFCEVVQKPCMILLANINENDELEVQYSVKSDDNNLVFPEKYVVPKWSKAYECKKSGWTSYDIEEWDIFDGTRCLIHSVGLTSIRKHQEPRIGIFIVPESVEESTHSELYIIKGDATEPRAEGAKIVAQVVNTSASVGFGFGKSMSKKYPATRKALETWKEDKFNFVLGESQLVQIDSETFAFQMLAQKGIFPKNGEVPLKYSSLQKCLVELRECAKSLGASVHMPMIGSGQAKGDWEIIKGMIFQELVKHDIDVTVYTLPMKVAPKKDTAVLSLFADE